MEQKTQKQLSKIPGISKIHFTDESLIRKAFINDFAQYSNSWLYVLRASHCEHGQDGYKFINEDLLAIIGYRNGIFYITPISDKTRGIQLQNLCQQISNITSKKIILKKYSQQSYPFIKYKHDQQPAKYNLFEDDLFPETILNLSRLFITQQGEINPLAKKFIRKVKRFKKLNINYEIINDIKKIPLQKIKSFLKRDPKKYASFAAIIKYLYLHCKDPRYKIMIFLQNNKVQGLYISEIFSLTEAGLYCAVTAKDKPGITEWMDYYFLKNIFIKGIRTVYIGGSDSKGVETYIAKLLPSKPDYSVQAVQYDNSLKSTKFIKNNSFNITSIN